ncbi:MAG: thiamine ABC transporter ATP-binding protein [Brucellaceae bacterium]|nr:thiamine ABC transporter ATP-binding protein [Brucellaceae bacterium]
MTRQGPGHVQLRDVRFAHGDTRFAFDIEIGDGAAVAVIGPSGSGKSTLLNLIAGFETPLAGDILIGGKPVVALPPAKRPVSMVFQENNLFAHMPVFDNVALGIDPALRLDEHDRDAVMAALARVGLAGMEKRLPAALSGGERQRVALARALVRHRPVLALDEPFAALGPALRSDMLDLLKDLAGETGMTLMLVTHQPADAIRLGGKLAFVENGRIAAFGDADALLDSRLMPENIRKYVGDSAES